MCLQLIELRQFKARFSLMPKMINILPKILADSPVWREFFEESDRIIFDPLSQRINELKNRNNIEKVYEGKERNQLFVLDLDDTNELVHWYVHSIVSQLGWHYSELEDYGENSPLGRSLLQLENLYQFGTDAVSFYPVAGTTKFLNFMSYILRSKVTATRLWYDPLESGFYGENDVINATPNTPTVTAGTPAVLGRRMIYDEENPPVPLTATNAVYPTPYIYAHIDVLDFGYLQTVRAQELVRTLFQNLAPADVVVHSFRLNFDVDPKVINLVTIPILMEIDSSGVDTTPTVRATSPIKVEEAQRGITLPPVETTN